MTTNRYSTRVLVRVDSHENGCLDLSEDVVRMQCNKQIKGRGRMQFQLVPNKNYLNLIHPNDVINLYVDVGDGIHGFVRTMFGYVDRVNRSEVTNREDGAIQTVFTVIGSDFQKAVEQTNVYFNPHLQVFIDKRFKNSLLGQGSTLRTNGVVASGTPSDFVENLLLTLAGFGQQWALPASYARYVSRATRDIRANKALRRLPAELVKDLAQTGLVSGVESLEVFSRNIDLYVAAAKAVLEKTKNVKAQSSNKEVAKIISLLEQFPDKKLASRIQHSDLAFRVYGNALSFAESSQPAGLIDLLEFGFIEHLAIDGFNANLAVWQSQGSLAQIIYGRSNPIINELMFDLRPISESATKRVISDGAYSKDPDELGINTDGFGCMPKSVPAVRYVPSVVMREYPFSVVEGYDLSNYYTFSDSPPVGFIPFGPIFSQRADDDKQESRVVYDYTRVINEENAAPLTPEACLYLDDGINRPIKHLDVVKVKDTDITNMSVGRDDNDVVNLVALYSNSSLTKSWKFLLKDFSPIVNPVSIARHGLRVQEPKTDWANYSRDPECALRGSAVDSNVIRRNLIRWQLLMDHWYQHNVEYLSGTCEIRGMPWIRVGYRLDFVDRNESYYVESVAHRWEYGKEILTSLQLSRGQRTDPYPAYIPPAVPNRYVRNQDIDAVSGGSTLSTTQTIAVNTYAQNPDAEPITDDGGDRSETGRLSKYFNIKSTQGTLYSTNRGDKVGDEFTLNEIDEEPNADHDGRAEYVGQAPSTPSIGKFGDVATEEDPVIVRKRYEAQKAKELKERKKRAAARRRIGRKKAAAAKAKAKADKAKK